MNPLNEAWSCALASFPSITNHVCFGFTWEDGVMTALPPLPGGIDSYAAGINNRGQIAGWGGLFKRCVLGLERVWGAFVFSERDLCGDSLPLLLTHETCQIDRMPKELSFLRAKQCRTCGVGTTFGRDNDRHLENPRVFLTSHLPLWSGMLADDNLFSFCNEEPSHVSSTVPRLLSRRLTTFSAFCGSTPTSSKAARKCWRNRSKCPSFRP
jgi:hypothetical protein